MLLVSFYLQKLGRLNDSQWVGFTEGFQKNSQQDSTRGLGAHEAVMEVTASVSASAGAHVRRNVCQRETLLHLFLQGNGEAKPPPAHTVTGAKKRLKKKN